MLYKEQQRIHRIINIPKKMGCLRMTNFCVIENFLGLARTLDLAKPAKFQNIELLSF